MLISLRKILLAKVLYNRNLLALSMSNTVISKLQEKQSRMNVGSHMIKSDFDPIKKVTGTAIVQREITGIAGLMIPHQQFVIQYIFFYCRAK